MKLPISVIVLAYNEENNIDACLSSVSDFVEDIFVVDSYSTDNTLNIVKKYTGKIYEHQFENWGKQRNWALDNLPIKTKWVLNMDSDHRVTRELKEELIEIFSKNEQNDIDGFLISRDTVFMGKRIKYGGRYPIYHVVLFKTGHGRCEEAIYDQHFIVDGKLEVLNGNIKDVFTENLHDFVSKLSKWAKFEAVNYMQGSISQNGRLKGKLEGAPNERMRFFKNLYFRFPLFLRPFLYFFYRFFIKLGFLDGIEGIIFHFFHGFWFHFLVDYRILEIKVHLNRRKKDIQSLVKELYGISI